jgi:hypothetical protein
MDHDDSTQRQCHTRGLYSPPGIPPGIWLESWNSARLIMEFDILVESTWNITGIHLFYFTLIIPCPVRHDSARLTRIPRNGWQNSVGPVCHRHVKSSANDLTCVFVHDTDVTTCDVTLFLQPTPPPPPHQ